MGAVVIWYGGGYAKVLAPNGLLTTTNTFSVPTVDLTAVGNVLTGGSVDANATGISAALYMKSNGNYAEADANSATTMPCRAMALAAGTGAKLVLLEGYIKNNAWSWTVGGNVYVSGTTGALTQTAPAASGDTVQVVGYAVAATMIYFKPDLTTIVIV